MVSNPLIESTRYYHNKKTKMLTLLSFLLLPLLLYAAIWKYMISFRFKYALYSKKDKSK